MKQPSLNSSFLAELRHETNAFSDVILPKKQWTVFIVFLPVCSKANQDSEVFCKHTIRLVIWLVVLVQKEIGIRNQERKLLSVLGRIIKTVV